MSCEWFLILTIISLQYYLISVCAHTFIHISLVCYWRILNCFQVSSITNGTSAHTRQNKSLCMSSGAVLSKISEVELLGQKAHFLEVFCHTSLNFPEEMMDPRPVSSYLSLQSPVCYLFPPRFTEIHLTSNEIHSRLGNVSVSFTQSDVVQLTTQSSFKTFSRQLLLEFICWRICNWKRCDGVMNRV